MSEIVRPLGRTRANNREKVEVLKRSIQEVRSLLHFISFKAYLCFPWPEYGFVSVGGVRRDLGVMARAVQFANIVVIKRRRPSEMLKAIDIVLRFSKR